jgi:hypothetical protein
MTTLTVVAADNVIVVDGEALNHNFAFPSNLWAIQWNGTTGHVEWTDGPNTAIDAAFAQPYIDVWQLAKDAQPVPVEPTAQEILNSESQAYLDSTDKFFTRFSETGKAMPEGMSEARAAARLAIVGEVS